MKEFLYLSSGLILFCIGYYFVVTGETIPVIGAFSGFFPTMLGVYLLYRWDKEHRHTQRLMEHHKKDAHDQHHLHF